MNPLAPNATISDDLRPFGIALLRRTPWWVASALIHALLCAVVIIATMPLSAEAPEVVVLAPWTPIDEQPRPTDTLKTDLVIPPAVLLQDASLLSDMDSGDLHDLGGRGIIDDDSFGDPRTLGCDALDGLGEPQGNGGTRFSNRCGHARIISCKRSCASVAVPALSWLATHQESDGHWDALKFGAASKIDTAITALALLAFSTAGESELAGAHKRNVALAVRWLLKHQSSDGRIVNPSEADGYRGGYPQALATFALCELSRGTSLERTRLGAQLAVDACIAAQNDDGGWRYGRNQPSDLSVTGWYIVALHSAVAAHLRVKEETLDGARKFITSLQVVDASDSFTPPSHFIYQIGNEKPDSQCRLTAIGTLARLYLREWSAHVRSSFDALIVKGGLPEWGEGGAKVDLCYWYVGSLCDNAFNPHAPTPWQKQIVDALNFNQRQRGDEAGSWSPVGVYSDEWGRVGQTALSCMCLALNTRHEVDE